MRSTGSIPTKDARALFRIRRSAWMRVIPLLRLYRCARCGCKVLCFRREHRTRYPL